MNGSIPTFIRNGDVQLTLERIGSGPRHVLFVHGWISARRMWYDVVARLDDRAFTMHLLDLRGCGRSDRPRDAHALEDYAGDVRAALTAMPQPVTLVGHSMGGKLAQYIAAERPERLERMILVAPGSAAGARASEKHRDLTLRAFGSRERIEQFQRAAMRRAVSNDVTERIVDDALVASYDHWIGWYDDGRVRNFSARLREIDVPVLAIAGGADPLVSVSRVRHDVVEAIDGALFVMLRDAGHNLPVETPDDIAEAIRRFGAP
jgi:3-oxoadipate enol-lactonase